MTDDRSNTESSLLNWYEGLREGGSRATAIDHIRNENRAKRGGSRKIVSGNDGTNANRIWTELVSAEPSPELEVAAAESFEQLLAALDETRDKSLRIIAIGSIEGNSVSELATELQCTPRTIQRKLKTIRALWESSRS